MLNESRLTLQSNLDKTGIICSGACAAHCLILPILIYLSPTYLSFLKNELIHLGLLVVLVPIALLAFYKSYKQFNILKPAIFGTLGISLLICAVLLEALHIEISYLEKVLTALGSIFLIIGHTLNLKLQTSLKSETETLTA